MRKVLVVEDNKMNRIVLGNILKKEYEVIEAENGKEALDILYKKYKLISAVILDISMPVMDGFGVLGAMRANVMLSQIPILVATGSDDEETEVKALSLGANDFVTKPYNPVLILHCLRNTINLRENASILNAIQRDKLTGLYNRETFFGKVETMLKEYEPGYYILACFDIDGFKLINDQYGAAEGDRILKRVGQITKESVEAVGGISGRISADNFAALYPAGEKEVDFITKKIKHELSFPDAHVTITFSIGRYIVSDLTLTASAIYDRAFIAKQSVKGRYDVHIAYFDESMLNKLIREREIIEEMDEALALNQFETWFQPQFNHATGALIGAEALVRWRNPRRGMVPPNEFIPVFEQNGFVYELDKYVWKQVCGYLRKWIIEGRDPLPVAVNISRYDVFRSDFISVITGLVKEFEIPVDLLRLEITESAFSKSTKQIIAVVKQLMECGFTVEIDDFGSGYSSLNTLKDVPADVLKLDMRFLEDTGNSQRGGNIVESIVRMAKWLDMSVIAEGVETIEQANYLKSIGCNYVQGYLYARPMPAENYEKLAYDIGKEQRLLTMETVENLNNNAFWNPQSMDTLIFNSFIGGACIFEYHNGKIELLRANDKYALVIGSSGMTVEDALKLDWMDHLDDDNAALVRNALEKSVKTNDEVTEEFEFLNLPGCPPKTYLRSTVRVIASTGDRHLVYCTNENITAQRKAEQKERNTSEQLQAIMDDAGSGITASVITDGKVRFLLANDKYFEIIGYSRQQYDEEVENIFNIIHPEDRPFAQKISMESYTQRGSTQMEYRIIRRDGAEIWVKSILSVTNFSGIEQPVQLCIFTDISTKIRDKLEIHETDEQLRFLNETAHDLLAQPDSEKGLLNVLQKLRGYFCGNRAYIFELNYEKRIANNTYEVCADGVTREKDNLQNVPFDVVQFWIHAFDKKDYINIADVDALDESRTSEKAVLSAQGIKSLIAVPLLREGKLIGFIGIDDPKCQLSRVDRLVALGDYIAVMLTRRDLNAKIINDNKILLGLMNDTPGGFVRMRVLPDGTSVPVYFNDGFYKLVDMNHDELMDLYGKDSMAGVHPDDVDIVKNSIAKMLAKGETHSAKYRLRHGKAGYIWLMFFGRVTKSESGEMFLNIYYTDASQENKTEEERKKLLDNLPCGTALYEFDGKTLKAVHLNKRYNELVGRTLSDLSGLSVLETVHPEDRNPILEELKLAIAEKRDLNYDVRILNGNTEDYRLFHCVGRIFPKGKDKYSLYVTFNPIADETLAYQEMLPVALNAVIGSSPDLSFVKDRNKRYICCNRQFAMTAGLSDEKEIIGLTDYDLVDKYYADQYSVEEKKIFESGMAHLNYEELMPTKDGSLRYSNTSKYPLLDSKGNVIGIYCVTRDITKSHEIDSQFKLLADNIPGGFATYQYASGKLKITNFNDGFAKLFEYSRADYEKIANDDPLSLIFEEDLPGLFAQLELLLQGNSTFEQVYRVHVNGGGFKWISCRAALANRQGNAATINVVLLDVTELQESIERLRISEEEHRLAMEHSGDVICRYNIANRTITMSHESSIKYSLPERIDNVPYGPVNIGDISQDTADAYIKFYEAITNGEKSGAVVFQKRLPKIGWRWLKARFSTIFSADGLPISAVVSYADATDQQEKETVYKKWQQSLREKNTESYTLFRCNISRDISFDTVEGSLLNIVFDPKHTTFNERTREYVEQCVFDDDRDEYVSIMNSDVLLADYCRGKHSEMLEYREKMPDGNVRWLRLSIDLVEYPNSTDVEAYLMYENIDDSKRAELLTIERAERDPLTGILNRATFAARVEQIVALSKKDSRHALLMLDVDGFKMVNDVFGHGAGDQALIDIAGLMRSALRRGDLLGRLGGDEFVVLLKDIPNDSVAANKAKQICALVRKSFSVEVQISGSIGIVICPQDGTDFDTLYKKVDAALYHVKGSGKNNYAFYVDDMDDEHLELKAKTQNTVDASKNSEKRRMLIVDDNKIDYELLRNIFKNEFIIEKAKDGTSALIRLRHYGSAISVVLLDLMMPGMDGFAVLKKMQTSAELQSVPVIVVSGDGEPMTSLRAIKNGASDFITKPVDPDLLRIRVESAISKAENERLRAKNSFLELESNELSKYRTVFERTGTMLIEYDWVNGTFSYDPAVSTFIAGVWDNRKLWHILLTDMVADVVTVKAMQELVHNLAENRERMEASMMAELLTPSKKKHLFCVKVYKRTNEYQLTDKLIITLNDTENSADIFD